VIRDTWARRLKLLRSFMHWLVQFEPGTEVPDDAIFGRLPERQAPHIYSEQEIIDLLAAARQLGPARGSARHRLRDVVRPACQHRDADLRGAGADQRRRRPQAGMLTIHLAKFGKSRQVPLHPSTVEALRRYRGQRDLAGVSAQDEAPFFVGTRGRRRGMPLGDRQVHRVFIELRERMGWRNRGAHHAPRIHDLRHTFVVRRIVLWQAQGVDVDQAMLSLSTYVGHAMVTNTYWYLSAVPELMALAAGRFETFMSLSEVRHA
jgi:integrase